MLVIRRIPASQLAPEEARFDNVNRFICRTCPYQMMLDQKYFERKKMSFKPAEDVLGGADSWKNVDKTEIRCARESCDSRHAYFRQVQIRSADEPMTSFYKCVVCAAEWREN